MRSYPLLAALAAVALALALSACGSSSGSNTQALARGKGANDALKFSDCMRAHGVTGFPDPIVHGNSVQLSIKAGSGVNPFSPSFKAARLACSKLLPNGGPVGGGAPSKQALSQMLRTSECMRAHGITDFPDPTTKAPSFGGGQGPNGAVLVHDGVYVVLPSSIDPRSPAFQQAANACGFGPGHGH